MNNVIYIHTHDSGKVLSPYGHDLDMPNLDAFAEKACLFDKCYCVSPTCSPSRAALLTGKYSHTNGMLGLANRGFSIDNYNEHIVNILNNNGYETVLCGIQHEASRYVNHAEGARIIGYKHDITSEVLGRGEKELVDWDRENTHNAMDWLETNGDKPFFLSLGYFSTHREYPDCPEYNSDLKTPSFLKDTKEVREDLIGHAYSAKLLDDNLGELFAVLEQKGYFENSIIIFTTDHGIPYPEAKCTLRDAGIGVSYMMWVPGYEANGMQCNNMVSHVDIMPTVLDILGIDISHSVDGKSFKNMLHNVAEPYTEAIFAEVNCHTSYEPIRCVRTNDYKYIRYYDDTYEGDKWSNIDNSISKDYYMQTSSMNRAREQFYCLTEDPDEEHNLMENANYTEIIEEHKARLLCWQKETNDYLLNGPLVFRKPWKINTPECINPKSRNENDFIEFSE